MDVTTDRSTPIQQLPVDLAPPISRLREVQVYENRFITLFDDEVSFPGGKPGRYVRMRAKAKHPGVALLVVDDDRMALVLTYRYPVSAWQWGIPRGFGHDADPLVSAHAELAEETGIETGDLSVLGWLTPDSGTQDSRVAVVLARVSHQDSFARDLDPEISGLQWPLVREVEAHIGTGEVEDGFTLSAFMFARARGLL